MSLFDELKQNMTRRHFFSQGSNLMGTAALASLMGGSSLASDIAAHQPPVADPDLPAQGARALFCFDGTSHLIPPAAAHALEQTWKLAVCPSWIHPETHRILSLSLPDCPAPTKTADAQQGNKAGTVGRLIPGYKTTKSPDGLVITSPDGVSVSLPSASLDAEDFLSLGSQP